MEWKTVKLGEVLTIKYGKDHKALGAGNIPVYGSGGSFGQLLILRKQTLTFYSMRYVS